MSFAFRVWGEQLGKAISLRRNDVKRVIWRDGDEHMSWHLPHWVRHLIFDVQKGEERKAEHTKFMSMSAAHRNRQFLLGVAFFGWRCDTRRDKKHQEAPRSHSRRFRKECFFHTRFGFYRETSARATKTEKERESKVKDKKTLEFSSSMFSNAHKTRDMLLGLHIINYCRYNRSFCFIKCFGIPLYYRSTSAQIRRENTKKKRKRIYLLSQFLPPHRLLH